MDIVSFVSQDLSNTTTPVTLEYDAEGAAKAGLRVVGLDSPQFRAVEKKQRQEAIRRHEALEKEGRKMDFESEEWETIVHENNVARATACTVGWFGMTNAAGEEIAFDPAMVERLFQARRSVLEKTLLAIGESERFLPQIVAGASSSTSGKSPTTAPRAKAPARKVRQ